MWQGKPAARVSILRTLALTVTVVIVASACTSTPATSPVAPPTPGLDATPDALAEFEPVEWRQNILTAPTDLEAVFHNEFAELLAERTQGKITILGFPGSSLLDPVDAAKETIRGTLKIDANSHLFYEPVVPFFQLWALPFWGPEVTDLREIIKPGTRAREIIDEVLAATDLKLLAMWEAGSIGLVAYEPLNTIESLEGKPLRISGAAAGECFRTAGAEVISMPGSEAPDAMRRNIVVGSSIEPKGVFSRGYNEFAEYWIDWRLKPNGAIIMMNLDAWNQLPASIQTIVWETAQEVEERANQAVLDQQEGDKARMTSEGMTIVEVDPGERARFRELCQEVIDDAASGISPLHLAEEFLAIVQEWKKNQAD